MCISMRPLVVATSHAQFSWIWSLAQWTVCVQDHSANSSAQIISSLDKLEQETTGPRATTPRGLSLLTASLTLSVRKPKVVIACRVFSSAIHLEEAPEPA